MPEFFKLSLAPLRSTTDALFRTVFSRHFSGCSYAIAPFITTVKGERIKPNHIRDILPENNRGMPVVPQAISNDPDEFIVFADQCAALGYSEVNLNMGCPFPMVAKKQRGSGLLPHPDRIDRFLGTVIPRLKIRLSIKLRLGMHSPMEIFDVLPVLNRYPLSEIIVHPRTGVQMYTGKVDLETFGQLIDLCIHPLVYNGDIIDIGFFWGLSQRFPSIKSFMIGRGAISDPFIFMRIATMHATDAINHVGTTSSTVSELHTFHDNLYRGYCEQLCGPSPVLGRMKEFWSYFYRHWEKGDDLLKRIYKTKTFQAYQTIIHQWKNSDVHWKPPQATTAPSCL